MALEPYREPIDPRDRQRLLTQRAARQASIASHLFIAIAGFVAGAAAMLFLLSLGD